MAGSSKTYDSGNDAPDSAIQLEHGAVAHLFHHVLYLVRYVLLGDVLHQRLADPLDDAAMELAVDQQRVDHVPDIVDRGIAHEVDRAGLLVDLDLADVAAVGIGARAAREGAGLEQSGLAPGGSRAARRRPARSSARSTALSVPATMNRPPSNTMSCWSVSIRWAASRVPLAMIFSAASKSAVPPAIMEREPNVPVPIAT